VSPMYCYRVTTKILQNGEKKIGGGNVDILIRK
jgi:hypothetical protein